MSAVPAHEATQSRDCASPNCMREAEPGSRHCRDHQKGDDRMECKIDGCESPANTRYDRGPFSGLCATHVEERRTQWSDDMRARSNGSSTVAALRRSTVDADSLTARARAVVPLATKLDRARAQLAATPSGERAKAAFDEASRRALASATPNNLARVKDAIKELQKSQPKRTRLENQVSQAERALGIALQSLVKAARGEARA